jgi:DNA-directed RNA polymerase specialized sigma24 family protein
VDEEQGEVVKDARRSPEETLLFHQQVALLREVLTELPHRERLILSRFYIDEIPAERICTEMGLTLTQFRLLKSRAKNRFGELGKKKLQKGSLSQVLVRFSRG